MHTKEVRPPHVYDVRGTDLIRIYEANQTTSPTFHHSNSTSFSNPLRFVWLTTFDKAATDSSSIL